ncbi:MAG: hypothetical protein NTW49_06655, partial [Bacteroidia bacterium]|nr:hypothetical protein [Bacteroidia bacterium]
GLFYFIQYPNYLAFMKKGICILLILLLTICRGFSQSCSVSIGSVTACPADTILIPVNASGFNNISAITLYIGYNSNVLNFQGLVNIFSSLNAGLNYNAMTDPAVQVGALWSNVVPANIGNSKLFDMKFVFLGGSCTMNLNSDCEVVNSSLATLNLSSTAGSINSNPVPSISSQPQNMFIKIGDVCNFSVSASGATSYQWMVSNDGGNNWGNVTNQSPYSNVTGNILHISNVQLNMNNKEFRCKLTGTCTAYSNAATLTVDTFTGIKETNDKGITDIRVFPNPCSGIANLGLTLPAAGMLQTEIFNNEGKIVYKNVELLMAGLQDRHINCSSFDSGIYFIRILFTGPEMTINKTKLLAVTR